MTTPSPATSRDPSRLVQDLKYWRAESPDEWIMDDLIRKAEALQSDLTIAQAEGDRLRERNKDDDYTITVHCEDKAFRIIAGKKIIDLAKSPEKIAEVYLKSVIAEMIESEFFIKRIQDENHIMRVALHHLAQPGNIAMNALEATEKSRQTK